MDNSKLMINQNQLNKQMVNLLSSFDKNKEWADLSSWLIKVEQTLRENPSPFINEKIIFGKRLTQCLNPVLPPAIHEQTLKIYEIIYQSIKNINQTYDDYCKIFCQEMGVYSVGLFPFYQTATPKLKYQDFYIPLNRQIIPCLPGLLLGLLPGLEDNNEDLVKDLFKTLDLIKFSAGRRYFIGSLWMAIMRQQRGRAAGIKLLSTLIPKVNDEIDDIPLQSEDDDFEDQIQQESNEVQVHKRGSVLDENKWQDFDKEMGNTNQFPIIGDQEESILKNRVKHIEENIDDDNDANNYPNKSSLILNALICCIEDENNIFVKRNILDFMISHLRPQNKLFSEQDKLILVETVLYQFKGRDASISKRINTWLFGKPDMENKYIINKNNMDVLNIALEAFKNIFRNIPVDTQSSLMPIKILQNFYHEHDYLIQITISKLSTSIIQYLFAYHKGYIFSTELMKFGQRFMRSMSSEIDQILISLTDDMIKNIQNQEDQKCLQVIKLTEFSIDQLFKYDESSDYQNTQSSLLQTLSGLFRSFASLQQQNILQFFFINPALNLSLKIIEKLEIEEKKQENQEEVKTNLDKSIQQFSIFMENIVQLLEKDCNNSNIQMIFKLSSNIIIKIQKYLTYKQIDELPTWFQCISKCIKMQSLTLSFYAIESIVEILNSHPNDQIYSNIKTLIIQQNLPNHNKDIGHEYIKITFEKLWNLLDYQHQNDQVIQLIISYTQCFPEFFKEVVANSFNIQSITEKEMLIRRFALFWKLTSSYSIDNLQGINNVGLFIMLGFLDHDNPLLRHASKDWLIDSIPQINRIIDPILKELIIPNDHYFITEQKQIIYTKQYDVKKTQQIFKNFKSILSIVGDLFIKYLACVDLTNVSKQLKNQFTSIDHSILANLQIQNKKMTYLDIIVLLSLQFMEGFSLESLSNTFHIENSAVNASSCEFLEMLICHIEDGETSLYVCRYILKPILQQLWNFIENKDYVMQIQILNLLKVIFFDSKFSLKSSHNDKKDILLPVLSSKYFIPNLLVGLHSDISYVRAQFINFLSICVPVLSNYLTHPILTNCIKSIMFQYYKIVQQLQTVSEDKVIKKDQDQNQFQNRSDNNYYEFQQNTYEIQNILIGISVILNFFLKTKKSEDGDQQIQNKSLSNTMASVLTLGLYNPNDNEKQKQQFSFEKHSETCECILYDIKQVVEILIHSWNLTDDFNNQCFFSKIGCNQYSYEKFKNFNPILLEMIQKYQNNLKQLIIKIFKSLLMQYPQQIMNAIIIVWNKECSRDIAQLNENFNSSNYMKKIIELLIQVNINNEIFLQAICDSYFVSKIQQNNLKKNEKKNVFQLSYELALNESRLLYLLYVYFSYNLIESHNLKKENLLNFWNLILKLLKILNLSKNPSTILWIMEFLFMLSIKYSPKEIMSDNKFKSEYHEIMNEKLTYCSQLSSNLFTFNFNAEQNESGYMIKFKLVVPFSPYHYEMFQSHINMLLFQKKQDDYSQVPTEVFLDMFGNLSTIDEDDLYIKYRLITIKTMQKIAMDFLQNSYSNEKNDKIIIRLKQFVDPLFTVLENKQQLAHNSIFLETISELIFTFIKNQSNQLVKEFKKQILQIFNQDTFFNCEKQTIRYYAKIINTVVQNDKSSDLFIEYLDQVTLSTSFFSKVTTENKKRIKSFKRVCFIIFSGDRDQYADKLKNLLDKISEVFKNAENAHPSLIILIFFSLRILILRLSPTNLNQLFRQIWPMLISLLIQIYSSNLGKIKKDNQGKNLNLLLAGLKLIEILSITQMEQFYIHQWMFIFDYFGLKIEHISLVQKRNNQIMQSQDQQKNNPDNQMSPFCFQPYISNILLNEEFQLNYLNYQYKEDIQSSYKKRKRRLVMTQSKFDDEIQLRQQALYLIQYLISNNEFRTEVDPNVIEEMFEDDFINLNETVLQV